MDELEPKAQQAVEHILARARHHGVVAGIHNAGPASALRRIGMGFQFVTVSSDAKLIAEGSQQIMAAMRAGRSASQAKPSSGY
jgi:4-hydroxy-2-oxoheptanedioate aldolase